MGTLKISFRTKKIRQKNAFFGGFWDLIWPICRLFGLKMAHLGGQGGPKSVFGAPDPLRGPLEVLLVKINFYKKIVGKFFQFFLNFFSAGRRAPTGV